jgi:enoyl-CoA hydratase
MSEYENLTLDVVDGIATVTITRPEKLNALDDLTIGELGQLVARIREDDDVKGVIVTGSGDRAFVAGADIAELATLSPLEAVEVSRRGQLVFREIELLRKPVVAAINGFALGGGCELALACHLRLATPRARFGQPEVKLGLLPGYGGTVRLARIVGKGRALEIILTGAMILAEEAYRIGLVNRLVEAESLLHEARSLLLTILANGPIAVGLALESTSRGLEMPLDQALALEANFFGLLAATEDMREGTRAFLERREPTFRGR